MLTEVTVQFNVFHALHSAGALTSTDERYLGQEYQEHPDVGQWVSICVNLEGLLLSLFHVSFMKRLFSYLRSRSDHVSKGTSGSSWMERNASQ